MWGRDAVLSRTDAAGNLLWSRTFGGPGDDLVAAVRPLADGGFVAVGAWAHGSFNSAVYLVRTDAGGAILWERLLGSDAGSYGLGLDLAPDGGFVVTGVRKIPGFKAEILLLKTDDAGNEQWSRTWGSEGEFDDVGYAVVATPDGGYAVSGHTFRGAAWVDGRIGANGFLLKTDSLGNEEWFRVYGGDGSDALTAASVAPGGYALGGYTRSLDGQPDYWVLGTDAAGELLREQRFGGDGGEQARNLAVTPDGGLAVVGTAWLEAGGRAAWLVKLDAGWVAEWDLLLGQPGDGSLPDAAGSDVAATPGGGLVLAGSLAVTHDGEPGPVTAPDGWLVLLGADAPPQVLEVLIDVMPGSAENPLNLSQRGLVPVAVLTGRGFDATTVLPETVVFAGAPVARRKDGRSYAALEDVDRDGDVDLLLKFAAGALDLVPGDTSAHLTGETSDGLAVHGSDAVRPFLKRPSKALPRKR